MSDEDNGGGERNLFLFDCEIWLPVSSLSSGEADNTGRWVGLVGPEISTGGAREPCDNWGSVSCDMMMEQNAAARMSLAVRTGLALIVSQYDYIKTIDNE